MSLLGSLVLASTVVLTPASTPVPATSLATPCTSWERANGCEDSAVFIEGLPDEAPRDGVVITVDPQANMLFLFRDGKLLAKGPVATGMDKLMTRGTRQWLFRTPRGRHQVVRKVVDPIWTKPDWAFIEEGKAVPAPDSPARKVKNYLGKYALDLGDGIMIHGTKDRASLGKKASHGCIRVGDKLLETLYQTAGVGTQVWIYDGMTRSPALQTAARNEPEKLKGGFGAGGVR